MESHDVLREDLWLILHDNAIEQIRKQLRLVIDHLRNRILDKVREFKMSKIESNKLIQTLDVIAEEGPNYENWEHKIYQQFHELYLENKHVAPAEYLALVVEKYHQIRWNSNIAFNYLKKVITLFIRSILI